MAARIASESKYDNSLVCECEDVTVGEVNYAVNELDVHNLIDLRRRTRVGMGTCQGELCACRAAGLLGEAHNCSQKGERGFGFVPERTLERIVSCGMGRGAARKRIYPVDIWWSLWNGIK